MASGINAPSILPHPHFSLTCRTFKSNDGEGVDCHRSRICFLSSSFSQRESDCVPHLPHISLTSLPSSCCIIVPKYLTLTPIPQLSPNSSLPLFLNRGATKAPPRCSLPLRSTRHETRPIPSTYSCRAPCCEPCTRESCREAPHCLLCLGSNEHGEG